MASVDFMKLHTATETKAIMAHCDKDERSKHEHGNNDIRKDLIASNIQMKRSYSDTCKAYDDRIASLDAREGANKRKDRVTCFALEIPFPASLDASKSLEWCNAVIKCVCDQYGVNNLMQAYVHRDEVHDYVDAETGAQRTSRNHMHIFVIPEHEGKLNGKWFSSKANMNSLNNSIQAMTQRDYGCDFMDGSKRKSKAEVEELKRKSEYKALEADLKAQYDAKVRILQQEHENLLQRLTERSRALDEREANIDRVISERVKLSEQRRMHADAMAEAVIPKQKLRGEEVFHLDPY